MSIPPQGNDPFQPLIDGGRVQFNQNGGVFEQGRRYPLAKKVDVARTYLRLRMEGYPTPPHVSDVAKQSHVSRTYAQKVIDEIEILGAVQSPDKLHKAKDNRSKFIGHELAPDECYFLLAMRAEDASRTNMEHCALLQAYSGRVVSCSFVSDFFYVGSSSKGRFASQQLFLWINLNKGI